MDETKSGRKYFTNEAGEVVQLECTSCGKIHDASSFSYQKNGFNDKRSHCKKCVREYVKAFNEKKEKEKADAKETILHKEVSKQFNAFADKVQIDKETLLALAVKELIEKYS
ncbi:hypothetical protein [Sporosarcina aquimarina]|uniref:hypothetical protein n=1 Tax=Sporosarcina aquimarina TaxID=114975 RepID=UPI001C8D80D2|nr:hypothetical protein [Sporosarcina aquimarina]